jgi:hypothetical protein
VGPAKLTAAQQITPYKLAGGLSESCDAGMARIPMSVKPQPAMIVEATIQMPKAIIPAKISREHCFHG